MSASKKKQKPQQKPTNLWELPLWSLHEPVSFAVWEKSLWSDVRSVTNISYPSVFSRISEEQWFVFEANPVDLSEAKVWPNWIMEDEEQ